MTTSTASAELSISFVSWINEELQQQIDQRVQTQRDTQIRNRIKSGIVAGLSAAAVFVFQSEIAFAAISVFSH